MNKPLHPAGGLLAHLLGGVGVDVPRKGGGPVSQIPLNGYRGLSCFFPHFSLIAVSPRPPVLGHTRPCLKIGGMLDWSRFFCQARRLDAGILTDFKSNQRSPGGKRCPKTAFCHFSNKAQALFEKSLNAQNGGSFSAACERRVP